LVRRILELSLSRGYWEWGRECCWTWKEIRESWNPCSKEGRLLDIIKKGLEYQLECEFQVRGVPITCF